MRRMLARGPTEARALVMLLGACAVMFIAQWPAIARRVSLSDPERWATEPGAYREALYPELGGALMGVLFFLPLIFYGLAALVQGGAHVLKRPLDGLAVRLTLFWALLAAAPLALLNGLVAGFMGPGPALTLVGALWFAAFVWIWIGGLRAARAERTEAMA